MKPEYLTACASLVSMAALIVMAIHSWCIDVQLGALREELRDQSRDVVRTMYRAGKGDSQ